MIKWIAAAALLLTPAIAHAQDWRLASQGDTTGSAFFVDAASVAKSGPNARGTAMVIMKPDDGVHAIETVLEFECSTGRMRVMTMRPYGVDEQAGPVLDGSKTWEDTPSNTQFGAVGEIFCGKRAMPAQGYGNKPPFAAWRGLTGEN